MSRFFSRMNRIKQFLDSYKPPEQRRRLTIPRHDTRWMSDELIASLPPEPLDDGGSPRIKVPAARPGGGWVPPDGDVWKEPRS